MNNPYLVALVSIALGGIGQFLLKVGADRLRDIAPLSEVVGRMFLTPAIVAGMGCFVTSFVLWVLVLRSLPLSAAYPLVSLSYVLVTALSVFLLHEPLSALKIGGLVLIVGGVVLIGLGAS